MDGYTVNSVYFCVHSVCFDLNNVCFDVYFCTYFDTCQYSVI